MKSLWPYLLVGLLVTSAAGNLVMVAIATQVPTFAVEDDYYRKSLDWDKSREERRRSAELGWTVDLEIEKGSLRARLRDRDGRPIEGATIRVVAFHNARAADKLEFGLDSAYAASTPPLRPGLWEFRFDVTRGGERFVHTLRKRVEP